MSRRRTSDGFSCFTIDALIGKSARRASPPPVSGTDDRWSTASCSVQYVFRRSALQDDVCGSPPPAPTTTTTTTAGLDRRRQSNDDTGGNESRHAFRVYRPASLEDGIRAAAASASTSPSGGLLATLHRRAMRWYSGNGEDDLDHDHWRTPPTAALQCDLTASRCINDIMSTTMSSTANLHNSCKYISVIYTYFKPVSWMIQSLNLSIKTPWCRPYRVHWCNRGSRLGCCS